MNAIIERGKYTSGIDDLHAICNLSDNLKFFIKHHSPVFAIISRIKKNAERKFDNF